MAPRPGQSGSVPRSGLRRSSRRGWREPARVRIGLSGEASLRPVRPSGRARCVGAVRTALPWRGATRGTQAPRPLRRRAGSRRRRAVGTSPARLRGVAAYWLPSVATAVAPLRRPLGIRDRLAGDDGVALTFDDGPHPQGAAAVLEVLAALRVSATFFLVGEQVERTAPQAREIVAAATGGTGGPMRHAARSQAASRAGCGAATSSSSTTPTITPRAARGGTPSAPSRMFSRRSPTGQSASLRFDRHGPRRPETRRAPAALAQPDKSLRGPRPS
jgi:hypothetical protein